jgi:hypothetical protein
MKKIAVLAATLLGAASAATHVSAADLKSQMDKCLSQHANGTQAAVVTLECTATAGKLSDCKVVSSEAPSKGFEKAAICVADALPMGSKSGTVRVPIRFTGA